MYFNKEQLEEIKRYLQIDATKDTSFPEAKKPFDNSEEITLVQQGKNVKTNLVETLELIAKFKGYFLDEAALLKAVPTSKPGEYAYVGSNFKVATVYKALEETGRWYNTLELVLDYVKVWVQGAVSVGPNGNWFNGTIDSGIKAQGPQGDPFIYENFTEEQIEGLQKPAIEAAVVATESARLADEAVGKTNAAILNAVEATNTAINTSVAIQKLGDQVKKDTDIAIERANTSAQYARDQGTYALDAGVTANREAQVAVEAAALAEKMANIADEVSHHPTYIGPDNYVYIYNKATHTYSKTNILCKGDPFSIKKFYHSIAEMEADFANMQLGDMVIINTVDPLDLDNSKMFAKNETAWMFLYQLSKLIGPTGRTPVLIDGVVVKGDDAHANLEPAGFDIDGNPVYKFNAVLPKGDRGAQGETGPVGPPGERGIPGINPQRGVDYWTEADVTAMQVANETYINNALGTTNVLALNILAKI